MSTSDGITHNRSSPSNVRRLQGFTPSRTEMASNPSPRSGKTRDAPDCSRSLSDFLMIKSWPAYSRPGRTMRLRRMISSLSTPYRRLKLSSVSPNSMACVVNSPHTPSKPGMTSEVPGTKIVVFSIPFAARSASTVVPNVPAIVVRLSPSWII